MTADAIPFSTAIQNGAAGVLCAIVLVGFGALVLILRKLGEAAVKYLDTAGSKAGAAVDKNTDATDALTRLLQQNEREAVNRHNESTAKIVGAIAGVQEAAIARHGDMREHVSREAQSTRDAMARRGSIPDFGGKQQ